MAQTVANYGLAAGADTLRQILAQRKMAELMAQQEAQKAQQLEFENQLKLRAAAVPENRLAFDRSIFDAGAQQRNADVSKTMADVTGKTLDTSIKGFDFNKRNSVISGLSGVSMGGRLSPRQRAEAQVFAGVDFGTPAGERSTVSAADLGKEQGQAAAAESASGGLKALADAERVKANEQIRVNDARPRADEKTAGPANEMAKTVKSQALDTVRKLKTMRGRAGSVGLKGPASLFGALSEPIAGTDDADFVNEMKTLTARLTLPQLQMMKGMGALSNMEGERIERSMTSLNRATSEQAFMAELDNIEKALTGGGDITPMTSRDSSSGDIRTLKNGQRIRVTKIYPDGTFDGEPVK